MPDILPPTSKPAEVTKDPKLEYIDAIDYKVLEPRIKDLTSVLNNLSTQSKALRELRYVEVDLDVERQNGRLKADELYIPQHIIDTNIRREQSPYIQYVTQSHRAVILTPKKYEPNCEPDTIEKDATRRLRYDGWQLPVYSNVDGFQQNGYGIMEVVYDESKPGHVAHEFVQFGDFGYVADTRDLQESEMVARSYYFPRTKLMTLCDNPKLGFQRDQVLKIVQGEPTSEVSADASVDYKDRSLFRVEKVMFRVKGIVHVAWVCPSKCDNWVSVPRPLFIGRRKPTGQVDQLTQIPVSVEEPEVNYPYIVFPYLITENDTISQLKGRVFLDQDCQEAVTSLVSSFCTAHRRAAGMYFSKDTDDPNADLLMQKNVYFEQGALINARIRQFQLTAPSPEVMNAVQAMISSNQNETSQVNFAERNTKDSRKTATAIMSAEKAQAQLSTVQVVLFSTALREMYSLMFAIIQSRILAGLIQDVDPMVKELYKKSWSVKASGDVDVIERQQLIAAMQNAWPVIQNTPAAFAFLSDMLLKMFPEQAMKYIGIMQQAMQQQAIAAQQQQQQMQQKGQQLAMAMVELAKNPDLFSDKGMQEAYPMIQRAASEIQAVSQQPQQPVTQ